MYLEMERDPSIEFDHFLCTKLGGMTVAEMRERMSHEEWTRWGVYYARKAQREELALANAKAGGRR
jgi:hypothetical protein